MAKKITVSRAGFRNLIDFFFLKLWNSRTGRKPKGHFPTEAAGLSFCLSEGRVPGTFAKPFLQMEFNPVISISRTHAESAEKTKMVL